MFKKKRRRRRRAKKTFIQRFFRSLIAVVVLTAFILGISLFVKEMAHFNPDKAAEISEPVLAKVGISSEKAGQVAGAFVERILKTNIAPSENFKESLEGELLSGDSSDGTDVREDVDRELVFRVALIADAHNNDENLRSALNTIKETGVHSVFFLGDYTDFGVEENLVRARKIMEESDLIYYSLPGDRDLYETVGPENFYDVFGEPQISVTIGDTKFVMLDNSANYTVIDNEEVGQFEEELNDADFVLLPQPLYHPLASYGKPVMGLVKGELIKDVKEQAGNLLTVIQDSDVKAVIAADHHSFSRYEDRVDNGLEHIVIGPVTEARAEQSKTSVTFLSVYDNDSYEIEEVFFD